MPTATVVRPGAPVGPQTATSRPLPGSTSEPWRAVDPAVDPIDRSAPLGSPNPLDQAGPLPSSASAAAGSP